MLLSHSLPLDSSFYLLLSLFLTPMASKKTIQPKIPWELDGPKLCTAKQTYASYHRVMEATLDFLVSLISTYHVSEKVVFKVPGPREGEVNVKGFSLHIALFPNMFSYELKLPFPHPVCDVLDLLDLAPSQLHLTFRGL